MEFPAAPLRALAEAADLPHLKQAALRPGVRAVYRISVYYADDRARHSVATLWHALLEDLLLEVVYDGLFHNQPLHHTISEENFEHFVAVLNSIGFDKLPDQPDLTLLSSPLWLVERASGTFYKSVVLSPQQQTQPYIRLVNAIDAYLPEAIREAAR